jgi:hypothetical protein
MLQNELITIQDTGANGLLVCLKIKTPVLMTPETVLEIREFQNSLVEKYLSGNLEDNFYVVWFLERNKGSNCYGLDFSFIFNCLRLHKDKELEHYIDSVFDMIFLNHIGLGLPLINCSITNRPLRGLAREFFLLNKISFIQTKSAQNLEKIVTTEEHTRLLFQSEIYEKNVCYQFDEMRHDEMRVIIEGIPCEPPASDAINTLKENFETKKRDTLSRIYNFASKNTEKLERKSFYTLKFLDSI